MKVHLHIVLDVPEDMPLKVPQYVSVIFDNEWNAWNGELVGALFGDYIGYHLESNEEDWGWE